MKEHLDELLDKERFELFVITTHDGFSIAVETPKRTLTGKRMVVITDGETFTHRVYIDDLFGAIDKPEAVHCQLPIVGAQRGASNPQPANYPGAW